MEHTKIIELFGKRRTLQRLLGHRHHTTVQAWYDKNRIPRWHWRELLEIAQKRSVDLKGSDFESVDSRAFGLKWSDFETE